MKSLYIVKWYDQKINEVVISFDPDAMHSLCEALDKSPSVKYWKIEDMFEFELPFYQVKFWKKLNLDVNTWFKEE